MQIEAAVYPSSEQLGKLDEFAPDDPVWMISLLKFRQCARYQDGSDADLSGRAAYARYATRLQPLVEARGGRVVGFADLRGLFIGVGAIDVDLVAIIEFPNSATWRALMNSSEVETFSHHRVAGLENQLLLLAAPRAGI